MQDGIAFTVDARDPGCAARTARLETYRGVIETPCFMPVGTQASVKALSADDLRDLGAGIILANAYHLYLRPGVDLIRRAGGLHGFMNWDRPVLTDSGGFQVFSLAELRTRTEDGVTFQSHLDGTKHTFTPESAMEVELGLGADIIMCFDECTHYPVSEADARESMDLTLRWARRCKARWEDRDTPGPALFGIVQGSVYEGLRRESAEGMVDVGFPGYAIGGVSVGESKEEMVRAVEAAAPGLPEDRPRYLMGVGPPEDILEAVERGVDLFDCVMPTRNARNGTLFTWDGKVNIKNRRFQEQLAPLDPSCGCLGCRKHTAAYMSHLFRAGEILALRLNTLHNLFFMLDFMANVRRAIRAGTFTDFKRAFLQRYMS
jgi:queuine tRNA-ribosyltransferase